jgi:cyclophilin family peptidyl-prolyl cis-trans isomerase
MVRRPLYNGVTFHRVIPGFMLQTGDPTGTGAYDAGFTVPDEFTSSLRYDRPGRLGVANIGQKNTGSCQFFITEVPTPHLNNCTPSSGRWWRARTWCRRSPTFPATRTTSREPR